MPKLSQDLVTLYGKYQALKNLLDDWLETNRASIMKLLDAGAKCPARGPFLLEVGDAKNGPKWKEEYQMHLRGSHAMDNKQIEALFGKISAKPRNQRYSPRLYCKRNTNYRRKFPIRLPK